MKGNIPTLCCDKTVVSLTAAVLLFSSRAGYATEIPAERELEARATIARGLRWLEAQQRKDGSWSNEKHPALTALPLWAFANNPEPSWQPIRDRAREKILSYVREDGGIYRKSLVTGGLSTYNTAICMTALHALGDRSLAPVILNARGFVAASQKLTGDEYDGGFGYGQKTMFVHADLQNTAAAVQAMRMTADVEDLRPVGEARADIDWDRVVAFVERLQNAPATGREHAGGITYKPGATTAGTGTAPDGSVVLRATGSMTYSGFLSLIYADLPPDDVRIRSAYEWATRHWTVQENPGAGDSGLYFYLRTMSRALAAHGKTRIPLASGEDVDWRAELIEKLVSSQKPGETEDQGYWVNDRSNRFWEGDAVLVTAYSILALQTALEK